MYANFKMWKNNIETEDFKECVEKFIMDKKKDVATEVIRVFA